MKTNHRYLKNVTTLNLDAEKCIGCRMCEAVCPHGVFEINKKAVLLDKDACIECGACALNCPVKALTVDSGAGCAAAFIYGWLTGTDACCGGSDNEGKTASCC